MSPNKLCFRALAHAVTTIVIALGFALAPASPASAASGNPLDFKSIWRDPNWPPPAHAAGAPWQLRQSPAATWVGGWTGVYDAVRRPVQAAASKGQVPVLVAYNIPLRDCGQYSAGGASGPEAYASWIGGFSAAIGGSSAVVILEPDALNGFHCMSDWQKQQRIEMLRNAVNTFAARNPRTALYIDAGHPSWESAATMAGRLRAVNVHKARGFALNVASFYSTSANNSYGEQISSRIGGKHFVVDTSRNGNGNTGDWCNPWGAKLGNKPTSWTGSGHADAYLWIKRPGESGGWCNGGPAAGQWFNSYAWNLAR